MALPRPTDLVEETIVVAGEPISLLRPRDSDELLAEEAFDHEELLPYWAEMWPSSVALAQTVGAHALRGARVLELGCGLGLTSIAATRAGGRVLATDWSAEALRFTSDNAARNEVQVETMLVDWNAPQAILERGPWQLVLRSGPLHLGRDLEA